MRSRYRAQWDYQHRAWRALRDMIREAYVRPSRWERFDEISEGGS